MQAAAILLAATTMGGDFNWDTADPQPTPAYAAQRDPQFSPHVAVPDVSARQQAWDRAGPNSVRPAIPQSMSAPSMGAPSMNREATRRAGLSAETWDRSSVKPAQYQEPSFPQRGVDGLVSPGRNTAAADPTMAAQQNRFQPVRPGVTDTSGNSSLLDRESYRREIDLPEIGGAATRPTYLRPESPARPTDSHSELPGLPAGHLSGTAPPIAPDGNGYAAHRQQQFLPVSQNNSTTVEASAVDGLPPAAGNAPATTNLDRVDSAPPRISQSTETPVGRPASPLPGFGTSAQVRPNSVAKPNVAIRSGSSTPSGADPSRTTEPFGPPLDNRTGDFEGGGSYFMTLLALFASVGLNLYLGWIAWDTYNRYQDLVADMRFSGSRKERGDRHLAESAAY